MNESWWLYKKLVYSSIIVQASIMLSKAHDSILSTKKGKGRGVGGGEQ
jgi:hypothetical protein